MATNVIRTVILQFLFYVCHLLLIPPQVSATLVNKKSRAMLDIISIRNCTRNKDGLANYLKDVKITKHGRDTVVVNLDVIITRIPSTRLQALMELHKCTDRSVTQCEYFMKVPMSACELLKGKNQFWTPIFEAIHPPLDCPNIKAGTYKVTNATANTAKLMDLMRTLPNLNAFDCYWKLESALVTNKKDVFCSQIAVKFDTVKINPT